MLNPKYEKDLLNAIDNNELSVLYQPVVDRKKRCRYIEATLRWDHPIVGNVPTSEFIPVLEQSGAMVEFGEWILNEACQRIVKINTLKNMDNIAVSINLSNEQLKNKKFLNSTGSIIKKSQVNINNIMFEISNNDTVEIEDVRPIISELRKNGCRFISSDSFGTGFCAFQNLLKHFIDIIKLDKYFTFNSNSDAVCKIVSGIITVTKSFDFEVTALGIEMNEQFEKLSSIDCDYFQGFYFLKPTADIEKILLSNNGIFI